MSNARKNISIEDRGPLRIIRFIRPAERNPLSRDTLTELQSALYKTPDAATSIVFTGTEDVFASGADIRELQQLTTSQAKEFSRFGQRVFQAIQDRKQVSIAAINGFCMGGALDLALTCDIRVASRSAVFSHPGARLGIITGWGGTQRLPRAIGRTRALDLLLTARRIDGACAKELGLVTAVGDPVLELAFELARKFEN